MNHHDAEAYIRVERLRRRAEERRLQAMAVPPHQPEEPIATWQPAAGQDQAHQTILANA